ncbi:hypothetical protein F2Q70_00013207 [Brassica cretica]|uniref:Uncharacterized protein n=1 Tax=Brassica cretica TaxID=69181 RepID=A0A8S9MBV5_BRACR|nr:hypothetical protein F2Q70_00013207 [Brassica cretica]
MSTVLSLALTWMGPIYTYITMALQSSTTGTNLMRMGRISEAQTLIIDVRDSSAEIDSGDISSTRDVHFANGITKDNKAPGNVYMNYSHPSSPALDKTLQVYLHNRGSIWYQRPEMYEEETRDA